MNDLVKNDDLGKLILRLTLGILILLHGVAKIQSPATLEFIMGSLSNNGLPSFLAYGVFIGEVLAPLLIILGLFTRYSAIFIIINMLFAISLVHTAEIFLLSDNGGWQLELQGFYLFTALAMIFLGSGRYAIKPD